MVVHVLKSTIGHEWRFGWGKSKILTERATGVHARTAAKVEGIEVHRYCRGMIPHPKGGVGLVKCKMFHTSVWIRVMGDYQTIDRRDLWRGLGRSFSSLDTGISKIWKMDERSAIQLELTIRSSTLVFRTRRWTYPNSLSRRRCCDG